MPQPKKLLLRCLLSSISLSGCVGVTIPDGHQVPTRAAHDLVVDNQSEEPLVVHLGRSEREARAHRIGEVWPLDQSVFVVDGPRCAVWVQRDEEDRLERVGTWTTGAPVQVLVR